MKKQDDVILTEICGFLADSILISQLFPSD
jgi:hypothetical protein